MGVAKQDMEDAKRISMIFQQLTEEDKNLVMGYSSALVDKHRMTLCTQTGHPNECK